MDFESLTAMLIGFLALEAEPEKQQGPEAEGQRRSSAINVLYSLRAINRFAPSIRVYVNHGFIHPRRHSQLFPLYDRIVRQVSFVKNTTPAHFHPKVWVIRYTSTKETPAVRYRMLVLSRNLTHDPFLDLAAVMDGIPADRQNPNGRQLAEFLRHLTRLPQEKTEKVPERIANLIDELPQVQFLPPPDSDRFDFLWNSPGVGTLINRVPHSGQALVLSPFLDNRFVDRLLALRPLTLISTSEALEKLSEDTFTRLCAGGQNEIYAIDPDIVDDENNPGAAEDRAYGLHAKMFLFENDKGRTALLGSANATMRGFERNCEAVVSLSPGISIAKFRSRFLYNDKKGLNSFIREYTERDYRAVNREEKEKQAGTERTVEAARTAVCQLDLSQSYDRSGHRLVLRSRGNRPDSLDPRLVTVHLCPLGLVERYPDSFPESIGVFTAEGLVFPDCLPRYLTEFVHCIIRVAGEGGRVEFIVKTQIDFLDLMDTRDRDIKRSILSNGDDFLRLILFGRVRQKERGTGEPGTRHFQLGDILGESVMIEDVMRACTEDPDKIEEINLWLRDLQIEDSAESTSPFIQFWKAFEAAMKEVGTRSRKWR